MSLNSSMAESIAIIWHDFHIIMSMYNVTLRRLPHFADVSSIRISLQLVLRDNIVRTLDAYHGTFCWTFYAVELDQWSIQMGEWGAYALLRIINTRGKNTKNALNVWLDVYENTPEIFRKSLEFACIEQKNYTMSRGNSGELRKTRRYSGKYPNIYLGECCCYNHDWSHNILC